MSNFKPFQTIALVKEVQSLENPGGLEKRIALVPADVQKLIQHGAKVYVEENAGLKMGFPDQDYARSGATGGQGIHSEIDRPTGRDERQSPVPSGEGDRVGGDNPGIESAE